MAESLALGLLALLGPTVYVSVAHASLYSVKAHTHTHIPSRLQADIAETLPTPKPQTLKSRKGCKPLKTRPTKRPEREVRGASRKNG